MTPPVDVKINEFVRTIAVHESLAIQAREAQEKARAERLKAEAVLTDEIRTWIQTLPNEVRNVLARVLHEERLP